MAAVLLDTTVLIDLLRGRPAALRRLRTLREVGDPLDAEEGWRAGEWRRTFATRGLTLAQADCLIAAAALALGGRLATGNPKDFPMPELTVEHWPAGE